jgi:hypothetical protein
LRDVDAVARLATDPAARVLVLVDGQNLYQSCRRIFRHPHCHPRLLADYLAGPRRRHRPMVRFYTGRANPNISERDSILARNLDRRLAGMRKTGVTVITRTLDYHWEWSYHHEGLPRPRADAPEREVVVRPWQRPQEKGIDVVMGLDAVEFVLTDVCDVAILVSADRDLFEVPRALANVAHHIDRPFRIEAAVPCEGESANAKRYSAFDGVHWITRDVFQLVRDDTFYAADPEDWKPPSPPGSLEEHVAAMRALAEGAGRPSTESLSALAEKFAAGQQ